MPFSPHKKTCNQKHADKRKPQPKCAHQIENHTVYIYSQFMLFSIHNANILGLFSLSEAPSFCSVQWFFGRLENLIFFSCGIWWTSEIYTYIKYVYTQAQNTKTFLLIIFVTLYYTRLCSSTQFILSGMCVYIVWFVYFSKIFLCLWDRIFCTHRNVLLLLLFHSKAIEITDYIWCDTYITWLHRDYQRAWTSFRMGRHIFYSI